MLKLELRASSSRTMAYASPVLALILTILFGGLVFLALGKNPLVGLQVFLLEPLRNTTAIAELLLKATPLVLCALGLSVCYRANVWNIGAEGQLVIGGLAAGACIVAFDHDNPVLAGGLVLLLACIAGIVGGAAWAAITAFLRDRFHANEILVSLMLTYIAQLLLMYAVNGPLKDPNGMNFPQSKVFSSEYLLPHLFSGTRLHIGFVVMLVATLLMTVFIYRSFAGFRLTVGGMAPLAARYAGFSSRKALWTSLLISGGFAGLAGAFEVAGPIGQVLPSISPGYGFAAIIVAFIGRLNPIGTLFGGLVLSLFYLGGELAQSRLGLPSAITGLFQGMLLFLLLACDTLINYRLRWKN
ncbi:MULTISPECIES: ABC transporter permease [unclassified Undibacterium]|uniref:ABC transporter permease n=1 Tax=unclassified Undibacterium TaxID=2630295 RepID=UPI002AC8A404|nr:MULTISPECIES: ABC transporter permease [unclassified Undibacterium]MEB0140568.1 ABC transporter permease [Undibacterium sp. CCC2.1]MEB0173612.1 ABC transporter permease [Undibacterium sp. CCC1.1]MEB0177577.1 ABC transporter permease [Undibacterium sp. CCC3.4]MEB0216745.1 ABC transporter permease [Undibacterium sp. 5I2]WPX44706.1 ABC transporter permease [Undibacterium sp. CCC3.4]